MAIEVNAETDLEIAHILFIDTVGYSKLLINQQRELLNELNRVVRRRLVSAPPSPPAN